MCQRSAKYLRGQFQYSGVLCIIDGMQIPPALNLLAISGSLRANSTNTALLKAAALLAPEGVAITVFEGLGALPHFNPDHADTPSLDAAAFIQAAVDADGLVIACPEYARGIPGSFKNALDWLVGSTQFPHKPVMLFNASPRASDAQAALRLVLGTMSARVVADACITLDLLGRPWDAASIVAEPRLAEPVRKALATFRNALQ